MADYLGEPPGKQFLGDSDGLETIGMMTAAANAHPEKPAKAAEVMRSVQGGGGGTQWGSSGNSSNTGGGGRRQGRPMPF
jgi:hypothetical protein